MKTALMAICHRKEKPFRHTASCLWPSEGKPGALAARAPCLQLVPPARLALADDAASHLHLAQNLAAQHSLLHASE